MDVEQVCVAIIEAAKKVHSALGPGLLESAYEERLLHELLQLGLKVEPQVALPDASGEVRSKTVLGLSISIKELGESLNIEQEALVVNVGERPDLVVEDAVIVELKAVKTLLQKHEAQLLSYLQLSGKQMGLLINFNVPNLDAGIKRIVNKF